MIILTLQSIDEINEIFDFLEKEIEKDMMSKFDESEEIKKFIENLDKEVEKLGCMILIVSIKK
ncbi:hypothetical protein [Persephonella sp.]